MSSISGIQEIGFAKQYIEEIDSIDELKKKKKPSRKWQIVWPNVILLGTLHILAVYGFYLRFQAKLTTILLGKFVCLLSGWGVTAGAHRLWTHRAYKANNIAQLVLILMFSTTYQNSVYIWARDHRLHHKHAETDADPHNANRGFFFAHVGWLLVRKHPEVLRKGRHLDMSDLEANPIVMFHHKYYYWIVFVCAVLLPIAIPCYFFGESLTNAVFVCVIYRYVMSVNVTWCINSAAHLHGNKPYDVTIAAVENALLKVMSFGEGYHNYHHVFPWDYRAAETTVDYRNLTTYLIDAFAWLGWVTERRSADVQMVQKRRERTGDAGRIDTKTRRNVINLLWLALWLMIF